jgi:hypothetical protein
MTDLTSLPNDIDLLVHALAELPGAVGVAIGGSRATSSADHSSDWDLAVYYRGSIDLSALRRYGEIHPPGSWGRIMNGGGWLQLGDAQVDVLLRDLDVALHWTRQAELGVCELDALLGYLAGIPTYSLAAELALGRPVAGELPRVGAMPRALVETAPARWRFARDFSLEYARMHAARGNVVGAVGQAAKAAIEEAHARLTGRGEWALNEKRLLDAAGLAIGDLFARSSRDRRELAAWLDDVARRIALGPPEMERTTNGH